MPLGVIAAFGAFTFLPQFRSDPALLGSIAGATAVLLVWWGVLRMRAGGHALAIDVVVRPEHYRQTLTQLAIFVFWGVYWPPMRDAAALIAAQLVFAYAFDMLLTWSRRDTYVLGFGPCPIIFSINLFIRFRDDVFALQFVLIAAGFLAKEFLRWNKDGRSAHIFNPSSFPLAIASLLLIVTHTTGLTWGEELATQLFVPPQIFLFIFLVALPGQLLFGVTSMTLPAVLTTYVFGMAYVAATGTYFFVDDYIPIAVFLGMHLLVTDPATAPRSELGRVMYGVTYGASVVALYALLGWIGAPTFYDKLLQVPIMNLLVQVIDRAARSRTLAWMDPARLGRRLAPARRHLAYTSIWLLLFTAMSVAQGLGDHHPGHYLPFWQQACRDGRRNGCRTLGDVERQYCGAGSGWACNEVGLLAAEGRVVSDAGTAGAFERACRLGFAAGCQNAAPSRRAAGRHADPQRADYAVLLREGKGPLPEMRPVDLYSLGCRQGWLAACGNVGLAYLLGDGVTADKMRAAALLQDACDRGDAHSCSNLGFMHKKGDGVPPDEAKALALLTKACDLGMAGACRWLKNESRK